MIHNILEFLEKTVKKYPQKIAVADTQKSYTYSELLNLAQKVGSYIAEHADSEQPIPVMMDKSADTYATFLGVVEAGCFYIPINPVQPQMRIKQILDTLQAPLVITLPQYSEQIRKVGFNGVIALLEDVMKHEVDKKKLEIIRESAIDTNILYCMFTSGSTGVPKGVLVSHRAVIDFVSTFTEIFALTENDVIGNQAPFDFDVSVKDMYSCLATGAQLVIIPTAYFSTPPLLIDYLCERNVTVLIWAVSALCMVSALKGLEYRVPEKIRQIMFSGEAMPIKQLNRWRKALPETQFVNLYGPTEIICNCTYYKIDRDFKESEKIPIGKKFPNRKVILMTEKDEVIQSTGIIGEICCMGISLANGYYNNEEQTKKHFIPNPHQSNYVEMMYRTGDLAYYDENGDLVFAGRKDFQIKHMGHRIELEEIELAIQQVPGVERGFCVFDTEHNRIVAFYCGSCEKSDIRSNLKEKLPVYMVPTVINQVDEIPLTKNGKLDRKFYLNK